MRFSIDLEWIFRGSRPEKSMKTIVFSVVFIDFHKINVFKKSFKKAQFGMHFGKPKPLKISKKSFLKQCFFQHRTFYSFSAIFHDFGLILGGSGGSKNCKKSLKLDFGGRLGRVWSCNTALVVMLD